MINKRENNNHQCPFSVLIVNCKTLPQVVTCSAVRYLRVDFAYTQRKETFPTNNEGKDILLGNNSHHP